jgi:hypothetical protein
MIAYGCCVGWWHEFRKYVVPWLGPAAIYDDVPQPQRPCMTLSGQDSIARAYNTIMDWALDIEGLDALVLLHSDLEIIDDDAEAWILEALAEPDVAIVGVAGGGGQRGTCWWECDPIGHQQIDTMLIDFASDSDRVCSGPAERTRPRARAGDVDVLEGSLLAFNPAALRVLTFDEAMPGFHGYDEICLQARARGLRNVVVDLDTHHHTRGGFKGAQSSADWQAANARSIQKWGPTP